MSVDGNTLGSRRTAGSSTESIPAWRRQLNQRWQAFVPRERQVFAIAAAALGLLLLC